MECFEVIFVFINFLYESNIEMLIFLLEGMTHIVAVFYFTTFCKLKCKYIKFSVLHPSHS